jgi:hypothetical protein
MSTVHKTWICISLRSASDGTNIENSKGMSTAIKTYCNSEMAICKNVKQHAMRFRIARQEKQHNFIRKVEKPS